MKLNEITQIRVNEINQALTENQDSNEGIWKNNSAIGERLYIMKASFNGDTKQFGDWLKTYCPKLDVKMVSYYIKLSGHNDNQYSDTTIYDWLKSNAINATNPRSCWDKFNKAHSTEKPADEKNGEVEKIEPLGSESESKDSLVARFAQIYDEFVKRQAEFSNDEIERLDIITNQFKDAIAALELEEAA